MLDATLKTQLAAYLQKLQLPIELVASLDDREEAQQMRELLAVMLRIAPPGDASAKDSAMAADSAASLTLDSTASAGTANRTVWPLAVCAGSSKTSARAATSW